MKYVYIHEGTVYEIIQEFDPVFPGMTLTERYPAQFLSGLVAVEDDVDVQQNMLYDAETGEFSWPEPPAPVEPGPEPIQPEPTPEERNRADIDYLALMMGVELP